MNDYEYLLPEGSGGEYVSSNERLDRLEQDMEDLQDRVDAQQILIENLMIVQTGDDPWLLGRLFRWIEMPSDNLFLDLLKSLLAIAIHACLVAGILMLAVTLAKGAFR